MAVEINVDLIKRYTNKKNRKVQTPKMTSGDWVFLDRAAMEVGIDFTAKYGLFFNTKTGATIKKEGRATQTVLGEIFRDGLKSDGFFRRTWGTGSQELVNELFLYYLNTGKEITDFEEAQGLGFNFKDKKSFELSRDDISAMISHHGIETASKDPSLGFFTGEDKDGNKGTNYESYQEYLTGLGNLDFPEDASDEDKQKIIDEYTKSFQIKSSSKLGESEYSPYTKYIEQLRQDQESAEFGLMQAQSQMQQEQADIAAQQAMMQQAQFKDQLIEQIKSDRLGKMRQGISPMQIANEELQMMVGGMQQNTQMMSQVNQQQLSAHQQQRLSPYQAYINSQQAVTGGQGYVNFAAGLDATRASSLSDQYNIFKNMGMSKKEIDEAMYGKKIK